MSVGRHGHGMAWAPDVGLILVVGGEEGYTGTVAEGFYRDWHNPQNNGAAEEAWKPMARMMVGTNAISMAYFKGNFIIAGGTVKGHCDTLVFGFKGVSQKEYEEGSRGAWFRLPHMPRPCEFEGLVATRNTLLGFGKLIKDVNHIPNRIEKRAVSRNIYIFIYIFIFIPKLHVHVVKGVKTNNKYL